MEKPKKGTLGSDEFPYCSYMKCEQHDCIRHWNYVPYNKLVVREDFRPNKDGVCKFKEE